MLLNQALIEYLVALGEKRVSPLPDDLLKTKIPLMLVQSLTRTILSQNPDGSWGSGESKEVTAYALMILKTGQRIPFEIGTLKTLRDTALERGRAVLVSLLDAPFADYNWNGKCQYGLYTVSRGAALAALYDPEIVLPIALPEHTPSSLSLGQIEKQVNFFSRLTSLKAACTWMIEAAVIEAELYMPELLKDDYLGQKSALGEKFRECV